MKIQKNIWWLVGAVGCLTIALGLYVYHRLTEKYGLFSETQKEAVYIFIDNDDNIDSVTTKLAPIATRHGLWTFKKLAAWKHYDEHIRTGRYLIGSDGADIVMANILAPVLIALAPVIPAFMKKGGVLISSGIIEGKEDEVAAAYKAAGLEIKDISSLGEWRRVVAVK